jgi:DNA-binding transcriptional MerR regulator
VRIAELSSRSGTSIPSIKFYLREGLLPPGTPTGRNQAEYAEAHVKRLRLIRALIDVGGLTVASAREVLNAVDTADVPDFQLMGVAHYALDRPGRRDRDNKGWQQARQQVMDAVRARGWQVEDESPNFDRAADAVAAMRELEQDDLLALLPAYAEAAERIAGQEVDLVIARGEPARMVEGVVTGTILGEALLSAMRRLAQQHAAAQRTG